MRPKMCRNEPARRTQRGPKLSNSTPTKGPLCKLVLVGSLLLIYIRTPKNIMKSSNEVIHVIELVAISLS